MKNLTPKVDCKYGAPMGRQSWNDVQEGMYKGRMYLRHVPLNGAGYDSGGAYWGTGQKVVRVFER